MWTQVRREEAWRCHTPLEKALLPNRAFLESFESCIHRFQLAWLMLIVEIGATKLLLAT